MKEEIIKHTKKIYKEMNNSQHSFKEKVKEILTEILITGASSGIGKETAKLFQSKGWNVIATMRNPENETELKQLENVLN